MFGVIILFIGGIAWISNTVITRYDVMRYEDSVDVFIGKGVESGNVIAEYREQKTLVNGYNFQAMRDLLTITERQKIIFLPDTGGKESITVTFDKDNYFNLYMMDENADTLLCICLDGKTRSFLIDGPKYRVFSRALKYIAPDGAYGQNDLITTND